MRVHVWDRVGLGDWRWGKPEPAAALMAAGPPGGEGGGWDPE